VLPCRTTFMAPYTGAGEGATAVTSRTQGRAGPNLLLILILLGMVIGVGLGVLAGRYQWIWLGWIASLTVLALLVAFFVVVFRGAGKLIHEMFRSRHTVAFRVCVIASVGALTSWVLTMLVIRAQGFDSPLALDTGFGAALCALVALVARRFIRKQRP
jgi:hypothetical protein